MPLTVEEQRELDAINAQLGTPQVASPQLAPPPAMQQDPNITGLTSKEEQELQDIDFELSALNSQFLSPNLPRKPGEEIPLGQRGTDDLLSSLGTKLPEQGPPRQPQSVQPFDEFSTSMAETVELNARADEERRQDNLKIFQELKNRGFSEKDIEERLDPTFVQQLKQDIGRTAGGASGGIAGAKFGAAAGTLVSPGVGTVIGGLLGAAIGAGIGGFVGEDVQNTAEFARIAQKAQLRGELTFRENELISRTEKEVAAERRNAAYGEAIYELGGRVAIGVVGKVFRRPFVNSVLPEVVEWQGRFAKVGGEFSPAQLVEGSAAKSGATAFFADIIDTLESIAEKGFGGRGIFKRFRYLKQQVPYEKLIKSTADDIVGTAIRMTPEQKALLLSDVINNRKSAYKSVRNSLYRWARKANKGKDILVSIDSLEKFLGSERRRLSGKLGGTELGESLLKKLDDIVEQVKTRAATRDLGTGRYTTGKAMTVLEVEDMLVGLNSELRKLSKAGDTPGKRIATKVKQIMTDEVRRSQRGLEPEVFRRLRVAKKFVVEGQPIFEEQFVKKLLDVDTGLGKNPEILNKLLFPNKKPSQIARARELIIGKGKYATGVNKRKWDNLTLGWLEDAIKGSANTTDGRFMPTRLRAKLNAIGDKGLDSMFGSEMAKSIKDIPAIGNILLRETEGGGSLAIRIGQIGAAGVLISGTQKAGAKETAMALLMLPTTLALLMTSKTGRQVLTTGLKAKPGSAVAAAAIVRMTAIAKRLKKAKGEVEKKRQEPISGTERFEAQPYRSY